MIISDIVKQAGKKLWPMTEGEPWQLEIIQRACNDTALPFVQRILQTTRELRQINAKHQETKSGAAIASVMTDFIHANQKAK